MIKVFVSSKQGELDPERAALHQALQSAEWDNFTIEFSGAFPDSVRDVFLQHVAECDVYLGIFASIYSQPTVDEYHKAKELGKPILIYLKQCANRDPQLQDFIRAELQPAHKYQEFSTTEELVSHLPDIRRALDAKVQEHQRQAYLDALVAQTELLELAGIVDTGEQERPKLQDIFVALSAAEEVEERDERQPKRERERERERPIKIMRRVTIEQALREHRHLMILGDPGAGKSTLLRYLTLSAALSLRAKRSNPQSDVEIASSQKTLLAMTDGKSRLPILIRLSSFAQSRQSFVEYFESIAKSQALDEKFFERALEDGQAIVCLDGLDEVSQPVQRIEVRNAITALANRYPRNRFIVTSRVAGYDSASLDKRAFAHHTIVPFGEKEIQTFVAQWYAAREREPEHAKTRAANLFNDLKANERLLKLAENPLTLTIIALVHQRAQGKLPDARVELYDRCAETLIEEWDKWKGLAPEGRERPYYQLRRRLLERAAYWMHIESGRGGVTPPVHTPPQQKRALEMKVAECLVEDKTLNLSEDTARIEAKQFVALATSRTGILVEREQGAVSFIHLTFQEYFAASDLYWRYRKTPDGLWQAIQPHLYDSRWLEVILLLLGRLNDEGDTPSIIVEKILREHDRFDDVIHRDLFLAARCLADRVNVKESLRKAIRDQLIEFARNEQSRYWALREDTTRILGTLHGDKHAADALLVLAQDGNSEAANALGQLGQTDDVVIHGLLLLAQDEAVHAGVQYAAVQALGQLGRTDDPVIYGLFALVQNKKIDTGVQGASPQSLGQLGRSDDVVVSGLLALAQDEGINARVRSNAVEALGRLGRNDNTVICGLLKLAKDAQVASDIRRVVVRALGQLGRTDDMVISCLMTLVQDKTVEGNIRSTAAEVLGWLGFTDHAASFLLTLVEDEKSGLDVLCSAAQALGQLGKTNDKVIHALLTLGRNVNLGWDVQRNAADALAQLGRTDDAVCLLLTFAQNERMDARVRCEAAQAAGELGRMDDRVIQGFLVLAEDERMDARVRCEAAQALGQLGCEEDSSRLLLAIAEDPQMDTWIRGD